MAFYFRFVNEANMEEVNSEVIEDAILELEESLGEAIILEATPPINRCHCIQAYYPEEERDDGKGYEIQISLLDETGSRLFRLYRYRTMDVREVISIFLNYFEKQQVPDVKDWEDMTDELH